MVCVFVRVVWIDVICYGVKVFENVGLIEVEESFCGFVWGLIILIIKFCILYCDWFLDRISW